MSERLQKLLAAAGLGSRREIEGWIREGRLRVNDSVAELGQRVDPQRDRILLDRKPLTLLAGETASRVLVYNKPEGEICSRNDPEGRPTVFTSLPSLRGGRWVLVGRLDVNTSGLLLFTNDGGLANGLMHPRAQVEREYLVRVRGAVDDAVLSRLRQGIELDDGPAAFAGISRMPRESGSHQWFRVTIREGRKREVRRLWESQEVQVSRLKRIRFGPISLSARLARGRWQELDCKDVNTLRQCVGLAAQADGGQRAAASRRRPKSAPRRGRRPA